MKTVYIETTIPNFYYEVRPEIEMAARREWTREWWDTRRHEYNLVTSAVVIEELHRGSYPQKENIINLILEIPILSIVPPIADIVKAYFVHKLMPQDPSGDALHLASASYYKCDFLLTWNCQHLANANKFSHIRRINTILGIFIPQIVTPLELLGEQDNET